MAPKGLLSPWGLRLLLWLQLCGGECQVLVTCPGWQWGAPCVWRWGEGEKVLEGAPRCLSGWQRELGAWGQ